MKIGGFHKNSFVDYPGNISAVVFTQGCNMNCFYCHNKELCKDAKKVEINKQEVMDYLQKRVKMLDAVVISGGEPTLQDDLEDFISDVKKLGYKVKLDTNGTNPSIVRNLLSKKLIDYVAMDIKAPIDKYDEVCGTKISKEAIEESIDLLINSGIDYEFRTTFIPQLNESDIKNITDRIKGSKKYFLQQYRPNSVANNAVEFDTGRKVLGRSINAVPHPDNYIYNLSTQINEFFKVSGTRGLKERVS